MNDERIQPVLDAWFRDRDEPARDTSGDIAHVMADVPQTRQQGRRWPLPLFRRQAPTTTAVDTADYRPSPIPATNGHAPIVIGRTQTMFSPVKAIVAGTFVFALGGLFLFAQPFDQGGSLPGAAQPSASATAPADQMNDSEILADGTAVTATQVCQLGQSVNPCTWTASDPRVEGSGGHFFVASGSEVDRFVTPGSHVAIYWTDFWIEGPDGDWTGHGYLVSDEMHAINSLMMLAGDGAYEGWSYVAFGSDTNADANFDLTGLIYHGPLPSVGAVSIPSSG